MRGSFVSLLAATIVAACGQSSAPPSEETTVPKVSIMTQRVSIRLGESGPAFAKRYPELVRVQHQPAGIDFYSVDWDRPRGVVVVDHGKNAFEIEDVLSVQAPQDLEELRPEGLNEFMINSGMSVPDPGLVPHDEARLKTYAILHRILDAGWQQVIERSEPRLSGKARQEYMFATSNLNGLDATYVPTFEDWMRIQSRTPWSFYANGVFMEVSFTREPTLTDPTKPGSYLLTFNVKTATEYFRGFAGPGNRLRWKEVVPQELVQVAALRAKKEAELRAEGVPIDESYQDPPMPSFK